MAEATSSAVVEVKRRQPSIPEQRIEDEGPRAAVDYMDRSQKTGKAPELAALLELRLLGNGMVLPYPNQYPKLLVTVVPESPADFMVWIGKNVYGPGDVTFRVIEGDTVIRVARAGKPECRRSITISKAGPNLVVCQL